MDSYDSDYDSISISSAKSFWEGKAFEVLRGHPSLFAGRFWDRVLALGVSASCPCGYAPSALLVNEWRDRRDG